MKNKNTYFKNRNLSIVTSLFIVTISFALIDCSSKESSKIPITTKSEIALEYYKEGLVLSEKLRGQEAVYFYLKALAEDNEFAMSYLMLAQTQTSPKRLFKYLNKAVEFSNNVSAGERYWILGTEAGINGDVALQKKYFKKLIEKYPNDEWGYNILANLMYGLQEYESAIKEYEKAIAINPNFSQPYNMLGYSYRNLGNYKSAEQYFIKYIDLISEDPNPYDSYAELLLKMGKFESSIEYYRKALSIKPDFIPSIIGIATDLNLLDQHQEAMAELNQIEVLSSSNGDRRTMNIAKAVSHVDNNDIPSAIEVLHTNLLDAKKSEDFISLAQDNDNLGYIYLLSVNLKMALKHFEKAMQYYEMSDISQDLKYILRRQLFYNAGFVAYRENDLNTLKKYTEKYTSEALKANNPNQIRQTHELAGLVNLLEEKYQSAIEEFEKSNQHNTIILYLKGTAFEALGDSAKAKEIYKSVANFNALNNMRWSYIRHKAMEKLSN